MYLGKFCSLIQRRQMVDALETYENSESVSSTGKKSLKGHLGELVG